MLCRTVAPPAVSTVTQALDGESNTCTVTLEVEATRPRRAASSSSSPAWVTSLTVTRPKMGGGAEEEKEELLLRRRPCWRLGASTSAHGRSSARARQRRLQHEPLSWPPLPWLLLACASSVLGVGCLLLGRDGLGRWRVCRGCDCKLDVRRFAGHVSHLALHSALSSASSFPFVKLLHSIGLRSSSSRWPLFLCWATVQSNDDAVAGGVAGHKRLQVRSAEVIPGLDHGHALQGICGAREGCRGWIATGRLGSRCGGLHGVMAPLVLLHLLRFEGAACATSLAAAAPALGKPLGLLDQRHDARRNDGREKREGARVEARRERERDGRIVRRTGHASAI